MNKKILYFFLGIFISGILSCTPRVAIKPGFDFTKVGNIGVGDFTAFPGAPNSSELVRDEFTRQLMRMGYNVKRGKDGVDYVFEGTIIEFAPAKRYLFYNGDPNSSQQQLVIGGMGLEISGSNVYSLGSAFGLKNSQIVMSNSIAGLSARLVDIKTGEIIWTNAFSFEALDIQFAIEGTVNYLLKSLVKPY